jgi:hypothetical protein
MVINNIYHFIFSFISFIAICEASNQNSKKDAAMVGLLYDCVKTADIVVLVDNSKNVSLQGSNEEFTTYTATITHVFKGDVFIGDTTIYLFRKRGKNTQELDSNYEYFVIAKAAGKEITDKNSNALIPVSKSNPILIPKDVRSKMVELIHEYTNITRIPSDSAQPALRKLIIKLLQSNIPVLQIDGLKLTRLVGLWDKSQWAILKELATGTKTHHPLHEEPLENLITVIISKDPFIDVIEFIEAQILAGNTDVIQYGLLDRPEKEVEDILSALVKKDDEDIQIGAIRIAGFLRRLDILTIYDNKVASFKAPRIKEALHQARLLANQH